MTAFAATFVSDRLVADAATGDYLAIEVLTGIVSTVEFYEGKTTDELIDFARRLEGFQRLAADERDWDEVESYRYEVSVIDAIIGLRAEERDHALAVERFSASGPLTHRPFAALAVSA